MDVARNVVVNVGMDRLFHEMVGETLSHFGWRVLDSKASHPQPADADADTAEIVLVAASGTAEAVINSVRRARAQFPTGKVVLLGADGSDADIVRFIEEGASAYVSTSESLADFIGILQMVRNNRTLCSGRITQLVLGTIRRRSVQHSPGPEARLTTREEDILRLIRDGLSNKEIASRLSITPNTVKNHVHHVLEKLKVRSRHEAAWQRCPPRHAGLWQTFHTGTGV